MGEFEVGHATQFMCRAADAYSYWLLPMLILDQACVLCFELCVLSAFCEGLRLLPRQSTVVHVAKLSSVLDA